MKKNLIALFVVIFCVMAEAKSLKKVKTPLRKPSQYEEIQKIKIHVQAGETRIRFEINASATQTITVFYSQFGHTHTLRSPLRDFVDLKQVFLVPGAAANTLSQLASM